MKTPKPSVWWRGQDTAASIRLPYTLMKEEGCGRCVTQKPGAENGREKIMAKKWDELSAQFRELIKEEFGGAQFRDRISVLEVLLNKLDNDLTQVADNVDAKYDYLKKQVEGAYARLDRLHPTNAILEGKKPQTVGYAKLKADLLKIVERMELRCPNQAADVLDHAIHSGRQEVLREIKKLLAGKE